MFCMRLSIPGCDCNEPRLLAPAISAHQRPGTLRSCGDVAPGDAGSICAVARAAESFRTKPGGEAATTGYASLDGNGRVGARRPFPNAVRCASFVAGRRFGGAGG